MEVVTVKYDSKNPNKKLFHLSYYKLNAFFCICNWRREGVTKCVTVHYSDGRWSPKQIQDALL